MSQETLETRERDDMGLFEDLKFLMYLCFETLAVLAFMSCNVLIENS